MLSKEELGRYLNKIRTDREISLREVYKKTGITFSHLSMIENGKRNVTPALLKNLAKLYNVDYIDLYEKAGYIDLIEDEKNEMLKRIGAIPLSDLNKDTVKIPVLGVVKAGYDYLAEENWQGTVDIKQELAKTGEFFALRIKGDSMFETLWNGDIVAVKKQDFAENGNIAVVLINGGEATVKQIKILENGIKLMPLNRRINPETNEPYYEDIFFTKEDIETKPVKIIGIVKQIVERNFF